jgi:hypothetical protein
MNTLEFLGGEFEILPFLLRERYYRIQQQADETIVVAAVFFGMNESKYICKLKDGNACM